LDCGVTPLNPDATKQKARRLPSRFPETMASVKTVRD
jgi:hypothetical protein